MKRIILILILISMAGCAPQYQKKEYSFGTGFSETQLDENIFRVTYTGDDFTDNEATADFSMLRCAELTMEQGYKYFVPIADNSSIKTQTYTTPVTYKTLNHGNGITSTQAYGGNTYTSSTATADKTIVMFIDKPNEGISYNAEFLSNSIREKYKIK